MDCPKCSGKTLSRITEYEIELDYCKTCGGIWFDNGELQKLLEMGVELKFDTVRRLKTSLTTDLKMADCPVCQITFAKVPEKKIGGLIMDQCPGCKGIWLDGGEFNRVSNQDIMDNIRSFLL